MFVALRNLTESKKHTNPTWISAQENLVFFDKKLLIAGLRKATEEMLQDLNSYYSEQIMSCTISALTLAADTRHMPLLDNSIDRIITSPPYLTRIDYAISTTPELSLFGNPDLLTHVRHNTMGAPVITEDAKFQKKSWGKICNSFLDAVASHPTKAARSYYWKNIVQYFIDMEKSIEEIFRVLKPGGKGLIVVQSSYFKDVEAQLSERCTWKWPAKKD